MLAFMAIGLMGADPVGSGTHSEESWQAFSFLSDPSYSTYERIALIANVVIALAGLGYALMLVKEVYGTDTGTSRMQEIARAVRDGADAYLRRQFTTVGVLIVIITIILVATNYPSGTDPNYAEHSNIAIGRGKNF